MKHFAIGLFVVNIILFTFIKVIPVGAETFEAPQRSYRGGQSGMGGFPYDSGIQLVIPVGSPEAILRIPSRITRRIMRGRQWSPTVSVAFNGSIPRDGLCRATCENTNFAGEAIGDCADILIRVLPDGRGELRLPTDWFRNALSYPYDLWSRWHTCQNTQGEVDLFRSSQRCPNVIFGAGARKKSCPTGTRHQSQTIAKPWAGWLLSLVVGPAQAIGQQQYYEFLFLSEESQGQVESDNPEDWRPDEHHYGELERLYGWYATDMEAENLPDISSISWVTGDRFSLLHALPPALEELEGHADDYASRLYLLLIRKSLGLLLEHWYATDMEAENPPDISSISWVTGDRFSLLHALPPALEELEGHADDYPSRFYFQVIWKALDLLDEHWQGMED